MTRARGHYEGDAQQYREPLSDYRDPLTVLSTHVSDAEAVIARAHHEVEEAYQRALAAPVADPSILWKDVYA